MKISSVDISFKLKHIFNFKVQSFNIQSSIGKKEINYESKKSILQSPESDTGVEQE